MLPISFSGTSTNKVSQKRKTLRPRSERFLFTTFRHFVYPELVEGQNVRMSFYRRRYGYRFVLVHPVHSATHTHATARHTSFFFFFRLIRYRYLCR